MNTTSVPEHRGRALSPVRLGDLELRNRIFVSAHTTNFARDFLPTDRHVEYHRERARGGAGLIITEPLRVHETSLGRVGGLHASSRAREGLERITEAVRSEGAAVFSQITHAGRHSENLFHRREAWGPSARRWHLAGQVPHAMTRAEMRTVREAYRAAARLAVDAGFQGVEVHLGHGHLLHQFISPASNDRSDAYGGGEEERWRFPLEVLDAVLDEVGSDALVGVRLSADELVPGGQDLDQAVRLASRLDTTRDLGFLNVSLASYTVPSIGHHVADMSEGRTPYLEQVLEVARACTRTPVMAACRVVDLDDAERALAGDHLSMVAMTRAHIADPHLIDKALRGREDEIRPCVSCNFCIGEIGAHRPLTCMMNPEVGHEGERSRPATEALDVCVVGAGPAGMEAAATAAERGHRVTLWEREAALGGRTVTARRGRGREELDLLRVYQEARLSRLGVRVRAGESVDAEVLAKERPDTLVVACGAESEEALVPGWGAALTAEQALDDPARWEGRCVVVLDEEGSWASASAVETLAGAGAGVHLVTPGATPLWGVNDYSRMTLLERLTLAGVSVWPSSEVRCLRPGVTVRSPLHPGRHTLPEVAALFLVRPPSAIDGLASHAQDQGIRVRMVGDALAPRSLLQAIHEGRKAGLAL